MLSKRTWKTNVRAIDCKGNDVLVDLGAHGYAVIDAADRHLVEGWNWSVRISRSGKKYVFRGQSTGLGRSKKLYLHHVIFGDRGDFVVDHRDGDTLNNRRNNLRLATPSQNARNRQLASNNASGFKGVCFRKDRGTWLASIRCGPHYTKIGTFATAEAAAAAYDREAMRLFGEFAVLNFQPKQKGNIFMTPEQRAQFIANLHDISGRREAAKVFQAAEIAYKALISACEDAGIDAETPAIAASGDANLIALDDAYEAAADAWVNFAGYGEPERDEELDEPIRCALTGFLIHDGDAVLIDEDTGERVLKEALGLPLDVITNEFKPVPTFNKSTAIVSDATQA
ncbi:HNH endonuclease [Hyphomicrobium methylovorum]|uniref:HNH endonuclease n=1 Tax=Hyphomicrobium methylovorum TaxID=84 RepID=UPI0015E68E3F|nr:HNH endonuclease [Hyphomicrobium methylovorum]